MITTKDNDDDDDDDSFHVFVALLCWLRPLTDNLSSRTLRRRTLPLQQSHDR